MLLFLQLTVKHLPENTVSSHLKLTTNFFSNCFFIRVVKSTFNGFNWNGEGKGLSAAFALAFHVDPHMIAQGVGWLL